MNRDLESGRSGFSTYIVILTMLFNLLVPQFLCLLNGSIRSFIGFKRYNLLKVEGNARDLLCKTLNGRPALLRKCVINTSYSSYQHHHYYSQGPAESLTGKCNLQFFRTSISQALLQSPPSPLLQRKWKHSDSVSVPLLKPKIGDWGEGMTVSKQDLQTGKRPCFNI